MEEQEDSHAKPMSIPPQTRPCPVPLASASLIAMALPALWSCNPGATPNPSPAHPVGTAPAPAAAPAAPRPASASAPTPPAPRSRADEPNTLHGVYTAQQADRGLQVYRQICSECHETADWTDQAFLDRWEEASIFRLWYWIYERMPHGNPGSLTRAQVTDALTYIFRLNGLPPGDLELGSDDDSLDDYWIFWSDPVPEARD